MRESHLSVIGRILVIICLGAGGVLLAVALHAHANDDPYITYRYARNLAQGRGFVYNVGLDVLSTTTPLYTLLLSLGYFFCPDLPVLSNVIGALSLGLAAILLYGMASLWGEDVAGLVSGFLILFFPLILYAFGAETTFHILLIVASFYFYALGCLNLAAATAGLVTLTRGDGVLVAIALAIHFICAQRKFPLLPFLVYLVVVAPWYTYSWLHFGSPFPSTLQAKMHQANRPGAIGFFKGIAYWAKGYAQRPIYLLYLPPMLVGGISLIRKHRWAIPLLLWTLLYLIGYSLLNVWRYHWYYSPLIPPLMLLVGLGISELVKWALPYPWLQVMVGSTLAALLLWPNLQACRYQMLHSPDGRAQIYARVGEWLKQNTSPQATVGALEIGIVGYFSDRPIVDFAGLIQPDISEHVEAGYENAAVWAITTYRPDYVVLRSGWFPKMVAAPWFSNQYQVVEQFENERYSAHPLIVYAADQPQE